MDAQRRRTFWVGSLVVAMAAVGFGGGLLGWEPYNRGGGNRIWPDSNYFVSVEVATKEAIRERIFSETPGLKEVFERGDELGMVRLLRGWSAKVIDINSGSTSYWMKLHRRNRKLGNMLRLFDENLLGVHCGDGSRLLSKVYKVFGYQSVMYNSGVYFEDSELSHLNEGKTHVITLVKVNHNGHEKWLPQDVLYDSEYRLPGEEASDFADLLARLRADPSAPVERLHDNVVFERDFHSIAPDDFASTTNFEEFAERIKTTRRPDPFKMGWDEWIPQESSSAALLRKALQLEGRVYPYHLFLFPIGRNREVRGIGELASIEEIFESEPNDAAPGNNGTIPSH